MTDANLMEADCIHGVTWYDCPECANLGLGDEWDEAAFVAVLPAKLRELSCPAGEPWTGDNPAADHGHTSCYLNHLAANEIDRLHANSINRDDAMNLIRRCLQDALPFIRGATDGRAAYDAVEVATRRLVDLFVGLTR